jgi:hypothetical protein
MSPVQYCAMPEPARSIPEVLPVSPVSLPCPQCGAKPGRDCETTAGGFSAIHIARIKAAARADKKNKSK